LSLGHAPFLPPTHTIRSIGWFLRLKFDIVLCCPQKPTIEKCRQTADVDDGVDVVVVIVVVIVAPVSVLGLTR